MSKNKTFYNVYKPDGSNFCKFSGLRYAKRFIKEKKGWTLMMIEESVDEYLSDEDYKIRDKRIIRLFK